MIIMLNLSSDQITSALVDYISKHSLLPAPRRYNFAFTWTTAATDSRLCVSIRAEEVTESPQQA